MVIYWILEVRLNYGLLKISFLHMTRLKIYCSEIFKVGPIKLDSQKYVPQSPRYTKFDLVLKAKKLSDIF